MCIVRSESGLLALEGGMWVNRVWGAKPVPNAAREAENRCHHEGFPPSFLLRYCSLCPMVLMMFKAHQVLNGATFCACCFAKLEPPTNRCRARVRTFVRTSTSTSSTSTFSSS